MEENTPNQKPSESVIRFKCDFCGKQIRVPSIHAGKKGKCPQCKNVVIIPPLTSLPAIQQDDEPIRLKRDCDMPAETDRPLYEASEQSRRMAPEPDPDAPPPFSYSPVYKPVTIVDVFAFPFSLAGILHFILFWFAPVFLNLIRLVPIPFAWLAYYFLSILFYAYLYYYLSNCVLAAAKDERSAPDISFGEVPTMRDLFFRLFMMFTAAGICFCPMTAYYLSIYFTQRWFWIVFICAYLIPMFLLVSLMFDLFTNFNPFIIIISITNTLLLVFYYFYFVRHPIISQINNIYWLLFSISMFLFPMFLLAAVMFDSLIAFNPFLIISSIFSTFLPYCGLAVLFFAIGLLMYYAWALARIWAIISWGIDVYLMFITSYILGRFFRRYEKRLNWEVKL